MRRPWDVLFRKGRFSPRVARSFIQDEEPFMLPLNRLSRVKVIHGADGSRTRVVINKMNQILDGKGQPVPDAFGNPETLIPIYSVKYRPGPTTPSGDTFSLIPFIVERGVAAYVEGTLRIYLSTDDLAYLQGLGETWDWGIQQKAQGVFFKHIGEICSSGSTPPIWSDPTLTINTSTNSYTHTIWRVPGLTTQQKTDHLVQWLNDEDKDASQYTGLMRFAVQACSCNTNFKEWKPSGWPAWDSRYYGLFRQRDESAETLRYWLVYIGPDGVMACRLQHHETVNCLVKGLYDGTYSGEQELNAEASVLVTLSLVAGSEQTLLNEAQMGLAYGEFFHVAHGWHFSPQRRGTASESSTDAVTVLKDDKRDGDDNLYWDTRMWTVAVSFVGEFASATLTQTTSGTPQITGNVELWLPLPAGNYGRTVHGGAWNDSQAGIVYTLYQEDGPLQIDNEQASYTAFYAAESLVGAAFNTCSNGNTSAYSDGRNTSRYLGGFSLSEGYFDSRSGDGSTWTWTWTEGGEVKAKEGVDLDSISSDYMITNSYVKCYDSLSGSLDCTSIPEIDIYAVTATAYIQKDVWSAGGSRGAALIITNDPTVVVAVATKGKTRDGAGEYWSRSQGIATRVEVLDTDCAGTYLLSTGMWNSGPNTGARSIVWYKEGTVKAYTSYIPVDAASLNSVFDKGSVGTDGEWVTNCTATAYHVKGKTDMNQDWNEWNPWSQPSPASSVLAGIYFSQSYSGELLYTPDASSDLISDSGHNEDAMAAAARVRHLL